jgi:hypothetical protein
MDERGNARAGKPKRSGGKRAKVEEEGLKPEKFDETYLQDLARRMNGVCRDSEWHFECALFIRDLARLLAVAAPSSRRA